MPRTLTVGSTGPDVALLQTTLNSRPPTALKPLIVDGRFGRKTLARVKEFQTNTFVTGVVGPDTWAKLLDDEPPQHETFYTDGRFLHAPNGQKVILRGINLPLLDDWNFPSGSKLADLEQTGANAVRIQWYINYSGAGRPAYTIADLDAFLTKCKANQIIPIVGLWDFTCEPDATLLNTQLLPWWTSDEVVAVLNKHKQYVIINLANELGFQRWAADPAAALNDFKTAYTSALTSIREKLHMPVMIDAPDCGTTIEAWTVIGQELIDHDPDHNLLLSVHAYWAAYDGMSHIDSAVNGNLPLVFGEIANKQDEEVNGATQFCFYDLDGLNQNHPPSSGFTYQNLLRILTTQEVGWLAWSWGPDGCASRNIGTYNQDTNHYEGLSVYGDDIVNHPDYGLKTTAKRPSFMAALICQPYYAERKLRFYRTLNPSAASPFHTLDLAPDVPAVWGASGGPNAVAAYDGKLFVSFDCTDKGGVLIYNDSDIYPRRTAQPPIVVIPGATASGLSSAGIAIEPTTGDLYIPTFHTGVNDAGVYKCTAASNYTEVRQFASFNTDQSVAEICANLAFDASGNLWMTTWSPDNSPDHHFLICYKGLDKNAYYRIVNTATKDYVATSVTGATVNVHLLSAPEGIAFDPAGNLWLGNNNDDTLTNNPGEGTLVKIDAGWLNGVLLASKTTSDGGGNYIVPSPSADVKYLPSGKLGGVTFDGTTVFVNDQDAHKQGGDFTSSGTVWKWDVTTPFNETNFTESNIHTTYPGNGGTAILKEFDNSPS